MRTALLGFVAVMALAMLACSEGDSDEGGETPAPQPVTLDPGIADALSCREPAVRANPGAGNGDLQGHELTAFPLASCNDGSPAVLYFRPYEGEANRDKWLIVLTGGGSCETGQDCADRWCGVDTNFNADNMSSDNAPKSVQGDGILERRPDNPFANYNHVQVRYCSSDTWAGRGLGITIAAKDPKTGKDVTFEANFAGAYVYEAMVATLRREGTDGLVYSRTNQQMPDLDDAKEVVFGGGSGGGAGVINNLDRFADALTSGSDKPIVRGFIEAIVGPDRSTFNFEATEGCKEHQVCDGDTAYKAVYAREQSTAGQHAWTDDSCIAWHKKNEPGTEWQCYNANHVVSNHITTPFFVRSSLVDQLQSTTAIESGLASSDGKPLTVLSFGQATSEFLNGLQTAVKNGHENKETKTLPGVFAPSCRTHYTLFQTSLVYGVTISGPGGTPVSLFDVWNNWVAGKSPAVVVSSAPRTDKCVGE